MKTNFLSAEVSYKGTFYNGLVESKTFSRNQKPEPPFGYVLIGVQQFGNGLRRCYLPIEFYQEPQTKQLKEGEFEISTRKTNLDLQRDIDKLIQVTKECYLKDNSQKHKEWLIHRAKYNMGLNNHVDIAVKKIEENWRNN